MPQPVSMTRAQYQATYGSPPPVPDASNQQSPTAPAQTSAPVKMTRAEYQQKYGQAPTIPGDTGTQTSTSTDAGFGGDISEGNYGGAAKDAVEGVGNFLFPIVGDIGADIQGKSDKSALEQVGDAGLSVLPFIPGLDETGVGEGIDAAVEGGEAAAKGAGFADKIADAGSNILSKGKNAVASVVNKIPGGVVGKGAVTGYGAGVASNLSQGQGLDTAFDPNLNTIAGTVLGGAAPLAAKGLSAAVKGMSGIDPTLANDLAKIGSQANPDDVSLMNKYNNIAKARATSYDNPSVLNAAADNLDHAVSQVSQKTQQAGAEKGAILKSEASKPLGDVSGVAKTFAQQIEDRFGLKLQTFDKTGAVRAIPIEGSARRVSPDVIAGIEKTATDLNKVGSSGKIGTASEVISNMDDDINYAPRPIGVPSTPLEGLLKNTRANLNKVVRGSSQSLADANDKVSTLKDAQSEIREFAGNKAQRAELLFKRVFAENGGDARQLFNTIKQHTGIDLQKHAYLAKNAIDNFGGPEEKSLLQHAITGAVGGHTGLTEAALGIGKKIAQKTIANPNRIASTLVKGKTPIVDRLARSGIPAKVGAEASRYPTSFLQNNQ